MQKLYTTTSKDIFTAILDILEIQSIYEEHHTSLNAEDETEYNIFVSTENVLKANALLKELLWETQNTYKPYEISRKILLKRYLEAVLQDLVQKEEYEKLLYEKGYSDEQLQEIIDVEYEKGFVVKHYSVGQIIWASIGLVSGGFITLFIAVYIRFSKTTHPLSQDRYYSYDDKSRAHAEFLIWVSAIITFFSVTIIY